MIQGAVAILGGSFDPIHNGHLHIASKLLEQLPIDEVRFLPCKQSVLKTPTQASAKQRLAMLEIALANCPYFKVDTSELKRVSASYTVVSLVAFSNAHPNKAIYFIMGMDAFISLDQWYQWNRLLELSHIVVINRPEFIKPKGAVLTKLLQERQIKDAGLLVEKPVGSILCLDLGAFPVSSTQIRKLVACGSSVRHLIPQGVWRYIQERQLYV